MYFSSETSGNNYFETLKKDSSTAKGIYGTAEYLVKKELLYKEILDTVSINVFIEKDYHRKFNGFLYGNKVKESKQIKEDTIVIISNYSCPTCYNLHLELEKLINKGDLKINYSFVYFGDNTPKYAKAPLAAAQQDEFRRMNNFVFEKFQNGTISDSLIFDFADSLNLNIAKFKQDYESVEITDHIESNKNTIIKNNIFSTPTFVINSKIYDEPNILNILKRKSQNE